MCPISSTGGVQDVLDAATPAQGQYPECIPEDDMSKAAYDLAVANLPPAIVNHSIRVYIYTLALAQKQKSIYSTSPELPLLFVACILHDIGTSSSFDGPHRFEIEGGDAAVAHLTKYGVSEAAAHQVWQAIALHTSPQIAERIGELPRLVRAGVLRDFGRVAFGEEKEHDGREQELEAQYPRLEAEKVLGDAVAEQAVKNPAKAPMASWPGVLLQAKLADPEWRGVNKAF
ncbi:hypothetical protein HWV62_19209 [Athelia sp. TMB]|nr:hypothetical protein HWV62_19209 [Athelia sp. TMB]